jgi:hypothetical protein
MLRVQAAIDAMAVACCADGRRHAQDGSGDMSQAAQAARAQLLGEVLEVALHAWRFGHAEAVQALTPKP